VSDELNEMDFLLQAAEEFGGSRGGYTTTGLTRVQHGIKVFLKGKSHDETFFPFEMGNQQSINDAFHAANKLILESGEKRYPNPMIRFETMKETILETKRDGTPVSNGLEYNPVKEVKTVWLDKEASKRASYPPYEQLTKPSLEQFLNKDDFNKWIWLQLSSEPDFVEPIQVGRDKVTYTYDAEGNVIDTKTVQRKNYVPVVLRRFESEEEARAYVANGEESVTSTKQPDAPEGWDEPNWGSWSDAYTYILNELNTKLADLNTAPPKVSKVIDALAMGFAPTAEQKPLLVAVIQSIQTARNNGIPF
jgi:hypothetical protein